MQPLCSADGALCLTADARVDNRDELYSTLTASGYLQGKDATDADLILAAYRFGAKRLPSTSSATSHLRCGTVASRSSSVPRDPFGIKPLHYSQVGSILCVASEAQQILQHPGVLAAAQQVAMADYLVNNCDDEERTMFLDVRRVPPGHRLIATRSGLRTERYWDIDPRVDIRYGRDSEYEAHFLALFQRAVADRLRSSGPVVGVTMSGGMDSTSIAAVAQRMLAAGDVRAALLRIPTRSTPWRSAMSASTAGLWRPKPGSTSSTSTPSGSGCWTIPLAFEPGLETPFMSWESLERHMLGRLREQGGRAILTGHGGDSLLAGTPLVCTDRLLRGDLSGFRELAEHARYRQVPYRSLLYSYALRPLIPEAADRLLRRLTGRREVDAGAPEWLAPDFVRRTGLLDRLREAPAARRYRSRARQAHYRNVMALRSVGRAVYWYDRSSAHFGLEARHPFLDRRLAEFLLAIPGEQLYRGGRSKWLLRRAMDGILPRPVLERRDKTWFGVISVSACETGRRSR